MKRIIILIGLSALSFSAVAGVVYEQSTNGGVIYVGNPSANTTKPVDSTDIGNVTVYSPHANQNATDPTRTQDLSKPAGSITLSGLKPGETIKANIPLILNVEAPHIADAHIEVMVDENPLRIDADGHVILHGLDRGSHQLQYLLRAKDGTVLLQGTPINFNVQQASELNNPNQQPPITPTSTNVPTQTQASPPQATPTPETPPVAAPAATNDTVV